RRIRRTGRRRTGRRRGSREDDRLVTAPAELGDGQRTEGAGSTCDRYTHPGGATRSRRSGLFLPLLGRAERRGLGAEVLDVRGMDLSPARGGVPLRALAGEVEGEVVQAR